MNNKKILVVDDDPDIVAYLCTLLEDNGYAVCSAAETSAALHLLEQSHCDLIIVDVLLPGRSGLDLLATLRKDPRWSEMPVVVLTGDDSVLQDGARSYQGLQPGSRGADEVLGKPLNPDELLGALERLGV